METYFSWERKSLRIFSTQKRKWDFFSFKLFSSFLFQWNVFVSWLLCRFSFFFLLFRIKSTPDQSRPLNFLVLFLFSIFLYFSIFFIFGRTKLFFDLPRAWRESPPKNVFLISESNPFIDFKRRRKNSIETKKSKWFSMKKKTVFVIWTV